MGENRDSECLQEIAKSLAHIEQLLQDMPERLLKRVPDMYLAYATAEAKMPKLSVLRLRQIRILRLHRAVLCR